MDFTEAIELAVKGFDTAGVGTMVVGALLAAAAAARTVRGDRQGTYIRFRRQLGRSILLGLELLVAADIIRTVAITPTLDSVLVLGRHRPDPHLPELLARAGDHRPLALAERPASGAGARRLTRRPVE